MTSIEMKIRIPIRCADSTSQVPGPQWSHQGELSALAHSVWFTPSIHGESNPLDFFKDCSVNTSNHANCCHRHPWLLMSFRWKLRIHPRLKRQPGSSWLALSWAVTLKRHLSDGRSHSFSVLALSFSTADWLLGLPNNWNCAEGIGR